MIITRFLSEKSIDLDMQSENTEDCWDDEGMEENTQDEEEIPALTKEEQFSQHAFLLKHVAKLLCESGKISSRKRLSEGLIFNHRRAPSAIGSGFAIPHLRSLLSKDLTMAFARCPKGVDFGAPDNELVKIFIGITAPLYDDALYLRLYKKIATAILETNIKEDLLKASKPGEIIRIFNHYLK